MTLNRCLCALALFVGVVAPSVYAADRMRVGQWIGTTVAGGKTYPTSSCVSQTDADAMNGDARAVQGYLETIIPPAICKITEVKADGNRIVYTASCGGGASRVVTTSYHGTSSEGFDSAGAKTEAKLTGPCK